MISYTIVRPVISPDLFIDIAIAYLVTLELALFGSFLFLKHGVHALFELLKCSRLIRVLISFILACSYSATRYMSCAHCAISFVDMLSTCTTRSISINSNVFLVNMKLLRHLGHYSHRGSTGVHSAHFFSLGYALHLMHPRFMLQVLIYILSGHLEDSQLAALMYGHVDLEILLDTPPSHSLAIRLVHRH